METTMIILLTILSTLGAVAIITLVAVAIFRLGRKIDELEKNTFDCINRDGEEMRSDITRTRDEIYCKIDELNRELDSRCDKLDNKIKISNNTANVAGPVANAKQILQG